MLSMKHRLIAVLLSVTVGVTALASGLVKNADFTQVNAADARHPESWQLPKDSNWAATNEDGSSGQHALRYRARAGELAEPVLQSIAAEPNTEYVISAALKSDGRLKPVVRVRTGTGRELVRVVAAGTAQRWTKQAAHFMTKADTTLTLELWADERHCQGYPGNAGTIAIDDVQILTVAEHRELATERGLAMPYENIARGKPY